MERIADDDQAGGAAVDFAVVRVVAVAPQHQLLENEERQDADQQRAQCALGRQGLEGLRHQMQQREAEQRPDGVADQPGDEPLTCLVAEQVDARCHQHAEQAAGETEGHREDEGGHGHGQPMIAGCRVPACRPTL